MKFAPHRDGEDAEGRPSYELTVELPEDFALDQPLSPFLLAALDLLDPESPDYALDVISLVEATLENPAKVLRAQERKARDAAMAAMKADGVEYEERLERLRAEAAKQAEEIAHMEAFIEKFRYKATKSKQVQDRVKKLEKIKRIELPEEIKSAMSEIDITPAVLSHGNKLMQLTLPDHTLAVMVKREGRYFIPKGNTELKENDKLLMISDNDEALLQAYDSLGVKDYTMKKN